MIAVIDYGMGNLRSVTKALEKLGYDPLITDDPEKLKVASGVILPGVGAFGDAMENLRAYNFIPAINDYVASGKPFLGICLGMQILFESSTEMGEHTGLGLIPGKVVKFVGNFKIPQMGWNNLTLKQEHPVFAGVKSGEYVYFVHSYHALAADQSHVLATTDYYSDVTAIVGRDNVIGMQFHPEKSSSTGLRLLENFAKQTLG